MAQEHPAPGSTPPEKKKRQRFAHDESAHIDASALDHVAAVHDEEAGDVNFSTGREREETEMDMTPMVDVTFLLLIFFMVTAAFSLQKAMQVPTPQENQPSTQVQQRDPEEDPSTVTVEVDENGTYTVITVEWTEEAPSQQELLNQLRRAREADPPPTKLLVMAHEEALHAQVVTALDAGTEVGMDEVQLTTVQDEI